MHTCSVQRQQKKCYAKGANITAFIAQCKKIHHLPKIFQHSYLQGWLDSRKIWQQQDWLIWQWKKMLNMQQCEWVIN